MSYRTDADDVEARITRLRRELAHRLDLLARLQREHDALTGTKVKRATPVDAELHATTDAERIELLLWAIDRAHAAVQAQRRENAALARGRTRDVGSEAIGGYLARFIKFLRKHG